MEAKRRLQIIEKFRHAHGRTPLHVLEILDDYQLTDHELAELLTD